MTHMDFTLKPLLLELAEELALRTPSSLVQLVERIHLTLDPKRVFLKQYIKERKKEKRKEQIGSFF